VSDLDLWLPIGLEVELVPLHSFSCSLDCALGPSHGGLEIDSCSSAEAAPQDLWLGLRFS
jgi:hypothetical protein